MLPGAGFGLEMAAVVGTDVLALTADVIGLWSGITFRQRMGTTPDLGSGEQPFSADAGVLGVNETLFSDRHRG